MFDLLGWLTGPAVLVSEEEAEWQWACFEWLLRGSGGFGRFRHAMAVLPTDKLFPQRGLRSPALEVALLEQIKAHAGMGVWPCGLEIQPPAPNPHVAPTVIIEGSPRMPLGTFQRTSTQATITYHPALLRDPMSINGPAMCLAITG